MLAALDASSQHDWVTDRVDAALAALDRAGYFVISKADALAAARCANNAEVLGVSDADPDLARRLEPDT